MTSLAKGSVGSLSGFCKVLFRKRRGRGGFARDLVSKALKKSFARVGAIKSAEI